MGLYIEVSLSRIKGKVDREVLEVMDREQLISKLQRHHQNVQSIIKILREIGRLDQNRNENLLKIGQALKKLEQMTAIFNQEIITADIVKNWVSQYGSEIKRTEEKIRKQFGGELENELKRLGLSLLGQYPELKAGLFTIELDFDQWKATLWYGPKQERLMRLPLSVSKVASQLETEKQKLGSALSEEKLLEKMREAYYRSSGMKHGEPAPIIKVLAELSFLLQDSRFFHDPRRENYRSYSRADFSYDLFRIRKISLELHLTVATRAHTRRRADFLWVPNDENGKGTTYSHLQFREVKT